MSSAAERHIAFITPLALARALAAFSITFRGPGAGAIPRRAGSVRYTFQVKKALRSAAELESVDARLEDMDRKLDRLRSLYESFFMGTERTPPNVARRDLNRLVLEMQQAPIGNAMMRFRFQSLLQRWVMLTTYWNRTMREIEAGTYARDLAKAQRHLSARGNVMTEEDARRLGIPASRVKAFVGRQQALTDRRAAGGNASAEPAKASAPGPASSDLPAPPQTVSAPPPDLGRGGQDKGQVPGLAAGELEAFYARFVQAHQQAVGAPPTATLEQMRAKLRNELPKLLGDKGGRVVLDVAVEGGKVRLKARPVR